MLKEKEISLILGSQFFSLMRNPTYGYLSSIEGHSSINDRGLDVLTDLIKVLAPSVGNCIREEIRSEAEKLMMENIKHDVAP